MNTIDPPADPTMRVRTTPLDASFQSALITTRQTFNAPPEAIWEALMFYEEIKDEPPFWWRFFLPVPIGTEGSKCEVGDEVKCHYVEGHLLKRVTEIIRTRRYAFEVIEQNIALRGNIKLMGGDYTLDPLTGGRTQVAMTTRYASSSSPHWICRRFEAVVCHSFHRHILTAMRSHLWRRRATG